MATHFKGPILYSAAQKGLENLNIGVWPDQCSKWDDFVDELDTGWTVVKDSGATVAIAADVANGVLVITSAATTDNDGGSIQANEIFRLPNVQGEMVYFETRIYVDSTSGSGVGQMDAFWGMCENFATNPEAGFAASNRIGFQMDDGSSSLRLITESGDTETETVLASTHDLTDGTFVTLGFTATKGKLTGGTEVVKFFVDKQLVGTHTANVPTANITPAIISVSGDATGTKSMGVDYVLAAQDRGVSYNIRV